MEHMGYNSQPHLQVCHLYIFAMYVFLPFIYKGCLAIVCATAGLSKGRLFKHLLGFGATEEGDPDVVFVDDFYPFYEMSRNDVIVFC